MPRFFFDLLDGDGQHFDDTGVELPDLEAAQRAIEMTLPRISAERAVGAGSRLTLTMKVRDEYDREVLTAHLDWSIRRPNPAREDERRQSSRSHSTGPTFGR